MPLAQSESNVGDSVQMALNKFLSQENSVLNFPKLRVIYTITCGFNGSPKTYFCNILLLFVNV